MEEPIILQITFDQRTGKVTVSGPIGNKVLCYGLMEMAKDVIRSHKVGPQLTIAKDIPPIGGV